ncbi:MAG: hypothetical protein QM783_09895 [Phycisphaerales bacterium]
MVWRDEGLDRVKKAEFSRLWDLHAAQGSISAEQHSLTQRLELGVFVRNRTAIYLDQKYWIYCRDAAHDISAPLSHRAIWNKLLSLTVAGRIVCPASYPILMETLKQGRVEKCRETAAVIDTLCCNIALRPYEELIRLEIWHTLAELSGGPFPAKPIDAGWTYPFHVVGESEAAPDWVTENERIILEKVAFDVAKGVPLSSIVNSWTNAGEDPIEDGEDVGRVLNEGAQAHREEVTSFEAAFSSEVAGTLDAIEPDIEEATRMFFRTKPEVALPVPGSEDEAEGFRLVRNLIGNLLRMGHLSTALPFIHVHATLHAAIRYRNQPYKSTDQWDHLHAHSALGYCDAFFTEKNLCALLKAGPVHLDKAYNCRVIADPDEVIAYLESL